MGQSFALCCFVVGKRYTMAMFKTDISTHDYFSYMTIFRIVSDLHLDACSMPPRQNIGADVALVAGDVVNGSNAVMIPELLMELFPEKMIIMIPGNHEGYRMADFDEMVEIVKTACEGTRVRCLHRNEVELDSGIVVLGATLWTDFRLFGKARLNDVMKASAAAMMDYRVVGSKGVVVTPEDTLAWHKRDRGWIEKRGSELKTQGKRAVMMSHHGPRRESLAQKYAKEASSGGFISHLPEKMFEPFELWVHGHTHTGFDYRVKKCRVICNPRGYTNDPNVAQENPSFEPDFTVTL